MFYTRHTFLYAYIPNQGGGGSSSSSRLKRKKYIYLNLIQPWALSECSTPSWRVTLANPAKSRYFIFIIFIIFLYLAEILDHVSLKHLITWKVRIH